MSEYSPGEIIGFDAQPYGRAVFEVVDSNSTDDGSEALTVSVLESTHPEYQTGSQATVLSNNQNLLKQRPNGPDIRDILNSDQERTH